MMRTSHVLVLLLGAILCGALPPKDNFGIIQLTKDNWNEVVMSDQYDVVVEFYSPSCAYCQQFAPIWNEVGKYFAKENSVIIARIDASTPEGKIEGLDITAVPTILMFPANDKNEILPYDEHRALTLIIEWILENAFLPVEVSITYNSAPLPANNDGPVKEIVGLNWKDYVMNPNVDAFINFYAPWCPYSKHLQPTWKDLGERLKGIDSVLIGQFDGTQNQVPGLHLHAYPTMILYRAGDKKQIQYSGFSRSLDSILNFFMAESIIPFMDPETSVWSHTVPDQIQDHAIDITELTDDDYEKVSRNPDVNVVILFYAPWCAHSQELFHTWEEIAREFKTISSVEIYQMDATKWKKPNVSLYPTIKIFPANRGPLDGITFKGKETTLKNIKEFIQTKSQRPPKEQMIIHEAKKRGIAHQANNAKLADPETGRSLIYKEEL